MEHDYWGILELAHGLTPWSISRHSGSNLRSDPLDLASSAGLLEETRGKLKTGGLASDFVAPSKVRSIDGAGLGGAEHAGHALDQYMPT